MVVWDTMIFWVFERRTALDNFINKEATLIVFDKSEKGYL